MERYTPFVLHLEFFLKYKIALKKSKALFMQKDVLHMKKYKRGLKENEGDFM